LINSFRKLLTNNVIFVGFIKIVIPCPNKNDTTEYTAEVKNFNVLLH
jgi:hypothetical protein